MEKMKTALIRIATLLGILLLTINIIGLFMDLRPSGLTSDVLRFEDVDLKLSHKQFREGVVREKDETDLDYANRLTITIANGLGHLEWLDYPNDKFHQLVPLWENYILHLMGRFSGIPEFERYHFSSPEKSMERGIGICGDAAILMSQLLLEQGIKNTIITIPGHVMINASIDGQDLLLDPDFGVPLNNSPSFFRLAPNELIKQYQDSGYKNNGELMIARNLASKGYQSWYGVSHFITKKYYFEKISYLLKWLIPLLFLLTAFLNKRR